MGYEIGFVRLRPGQTFGAAYAEIARALEHADDVPPPWTPGALERVTWRRVVSRLRTRFGDLAEIRHDTHLELSQAEPRWVLRYHAVGAELTIPYAYPGDRADAVVRRLYAVATVLAAETGLAGYDRQLGRPADPAALGAAVAHYRRVAEWPAATCSKPRRPGSRRVGVGAATLWACPTPPPSPAGSPGPGP